MRVIAGDRKGIVLTAVFSSGCRPTTQLVKGSIFDTMGDIINGKKVVDLFAGSGGIGIEALSRGAAHVVFVEKNRRLLKVIRHNLKICHFGSEVAAVKGEDALVFLRKLSRDGNPTDIIFADPPYAEDYPGKILDTIDNVEECPCKLLIIEHPTGLELKGGEKLDKWRTRSFGQTSVSYFNCGKEIK